MLAVALAAMAPMQDRDVTFAYRPRARVTSVHVVGQFNAWDKARDPLVPGKDGTWRATVRIPPGVYQYLFVEDGKTWLPDPKAPFVLDTNGNKNSQLVVRPASFDQHKGRVGDGDVTVGAILHDPVTMTVRRRMDDFLLQVRTRANDVEQVTVLGKDFRIEMRPVTKDPLYWVWQASGISAQSGGLEYRFEVRDRENKAVTETFHQHIADYPLPSPPGWVQDAVFYQIFPDRFANGHTANDTELAKSWSDVPAPRGWLGGDIRGIVDHMDHLEQLGVNAVYLNPVFKAMSYHGYDTVDYMNIDPHFGSNEQFHQLVKRLGLRGLKVVIDGVFNHSSPDFFAFKDLQENGTASAYNDWYTVLKHPIEVKEGQQTYLGWAGVFLMPKLRTEQPVVQDYILKVAEHWIKEYGVAGWRLDVADEVYPPFWKRFRQTVRSADPEAFILGEEWGDAHQYLQGDMHDSVMNYRWRKLALDFFIGHKLKPSEFETELAYLREQYPAALETRVFNLLGSHDTPRVRTLCKKDRALERQLALFQFTYPGIPSVYYGDEVGMEGGRDPDCRRGMDWTKKTWDLGLFEFYKKLVAMRREYRCLRAGSISPIKGLNPKLYGFERELGGTVISVVFNPTKTKLEIGAGLDGADALVNEGINGRFIGPGACGALIGLQPRQR